MSILKQLKLLHFEEWMRRSVDLSYLEGWADYYTLRGQPVPMNLQLKVVGLRRSLRGRESSQ